MNPTFLDNMSWEMAEVYGAITDQILINLSRYFPYFKAGNVPKSAFTYQAAMLAKMGQVNADTIRIIKNNLQGADKALSDVLEQSIVDAVSKAEPGLLNAVKAGILKPAGIPTVEPSQMRAFTLYYQQAAQKLNLVNTVMLESTKQAFQATVADVVNRIQVTQTALDIGAGETITGVSSWNQALRHSINRMKENGITGFIDHGNHHWSAEAYVAMDIRTTVYNTGRAAVWETNQDFGNDLYIVSYHDGARPLCYPWQNKVISSTNNARIVKDLDGNEIQVIAQSDTSYGEPAGLFGINCKHYPSPFIPGVSVLYDQSNIPSEAENEKIYQQTQDQRALERKLREEKRDLLIAKEMGADADEIKALRAKCRQTSDDIDAFCEETGLPRRQNREGVFTKRDFPAADTYDVAEFERTQKDEIDKFFRNGGAQQGYTFGEMMPNTQLAQTNKTNYDFGGSNATITQEGQTMIRNTVQMLQKEYPIPQGYSLNVTDFRVNRGIGFDEDLFDVLDRLEQEKNEHYFGVTAQFLPDIKDDGNLTIEFIDTLQQSATPKEEAFEAIHSAMVKSGGNAFNAGYGYECTTIHEYGHLLAKIYGFYGSMDSEFIAWFESIDIELIKRELSLYAATNSNEFFAEAFMQSFSPYQSELSKQAMEYLRKKMTGI